MEAREGTPQLKFMFTIGSMFEPASDTDHETAALGLWGEWKHPPSSGEWSLSAHRFQASFTHHSDRRTHLEIPFRTPTAWSLARPLSTATASRPAVLACGRSRPAR